MSYEFNEDGEEDLSQEEIARISGVLEIVEAKFEQAKALLKEATTLALASNLGSFRVDFGEIEDYTGEYWLTNDGWKSSWWND